VSLDETRAAFQGWLHLPDTGALDVVLATVAANRLDGDPCWTLLIGPPGGGKSELLNAVSGLEDAHPTATLTEAALLSGTPNKERATGAKGGLLREIGNYGLREEYRTTREYLSPREVAAHPRVSVKTIRRRIDDGTLPAVRPGEHGRHPPTRKKCRKRYAATAAGIVALTAVRIRSATAAGTRHDLRVRVMLGFLSVVITINIAQWLHGGLQPEDSWQDPLAAVIIIVGVAIALVIVIPAGRRRR